MAQLENGSTPTGTQDDPETMMYNARMDTNGPTTANSKLTSRVNYSSSIHSTEIVHALFGACMGPCWGDFSCHYNRHHGRLYASRNGILFYSNLFGSERRIGVFWRDVLEVKTHRSTSVRITTTDDEEYIFKAFNDREHVLHLLKKLKQEASDIPVAEGIHGDTIEVPSVIQSDINTTARKEPQSFPSSPRFAPAEGRKPTTLDQSVSNNTRESEEEDESDTVPVVSPENLQEAWEGLKNSANPKMDTTLDQIPLQPCTLDAFFDVFVADEAPHSIESYMIEVIGDSEVETSPWTRDGDTQIRTTKFRHSIPKTFGGVGPSFAMTTRHQRLRRFGVCGMCIESSTEVKGIPAADCFRVEEQWLVQPGLNNNDVTLTVRGYTRFIKGTLLKSMIQNSVRKETTIWLKGYCDMLQAVLKDEKPKNETEKLSQPVEEVVTTHKTMFRAQRIALPGIMIFLALFLIALLSLMVFYVRALNNQMDLLQQEMKQLRVQQHEMTTRLRLIESQQENS